MIKEGVLGMTHEEMKKRDEEIFRRMKASYYGDNITWVDKMGVPFPLEMYKELFPLHHYVIGKESMDYWEELRRTQWLKREEILKLQAEKLKKIIDYAYGNVAFYRKRFDEAGVSPADIKTVDDLKKFPLLSKDDIKNNDLTSHMEFDPDTMLHVHTGGSTAEPLEFNCDKKQLDYRLAAFLRLMEWTGWKWGDREMRCWFATAGDGYKYPEIEKRDAFLFNRIFMSLYTLDDESIPAILQEIEEKKPYVMDGYAEIFNCLAEYMKKHDIYLRVNAIISSSQTLTPKSRELMMKHFSCDVFDKYGCREFSGIANECEKHEGLHVNAENLIVEILKDGRPVEEGEVGEVVITDLNNLATPFIRYRVGDTARFTGRSCSCGRGLPMIQNVEGRIQAIIQGTNGRYLVGTFFPHFVKDMKGIDKFQIRQDKFGEAKIYIVKNRNYTEEEMRGAIDEFRKYLGEDMRFEIETVDDIPLYRGKRHHSISTLDFRFNQ